MKRIVSILLALILALSLVPTMAFAADKVTFGVKASKSSLTIGDEVEVTVSVNAIKASRGVAIYLNYDKSKVEYVSGAPVTTTTLGKDADYNHLAAKNQTGFIAELKNATDVSASDLMKVKFKAIAEGDATFTLSAGEAYYGEGASLGEYDVDQSATAKVSISKPVVKVESVTVAPATLNLEVGQTGTLTATVNPANATDKTVTWKTSNANVAAVAANGVVTAVAKGTATITATAGGKTATCTVTVKEPTCNHSEDKLTLVPSKAATCTEDGVKEHYLCKCGTKLDVDKKTVLTTTVIPATGHKTEKEENKATCTKLAVCDVCGKSYGSLEKHTVVKVDKVDPTCSTIGMKEHYECSVCHKWFSDEDGTKEISEADKASYVIAVDPELHVYDIVKDTYREYAEGYYVEKLQCTKCGDSHWLASVDFRDVAVKLVQEGNGDLKDVEVNVVSTSVKTKEVMSLYRNDYAKAGDTLNLPVFFNYSKSATEAEAIAALKKDIAENPTFTVEAAATKSGWKFTADKTYTVTVELNDGKVVTKWVASDKTEVGAEETPTITITGKQDAGGTTGGNGGGGSKNNTTKKDDGKKVESGKTFDAGIAMYVGLSVLSVTGGALVIGKKKERF